MNKELKRRIARLEAKPRSNLRIAEDYFWQAVTANKGRFSPEHACMTDAERVASLTPVQHMAWLRRFKGEADLEKVTALHGKQVPTDWLSWAMLTRWMPGDDTM